MMNYGLSQSLRGARSPSGLQIHSLCCLCSLILTGPMQHSILISEKENDTFRLTENEQETAGGKRKYTLHES